MSWKHLTAGSLVALAALMLGAGAGFAGNGSGAGDCTGPLHDILGGEPFTYAGTVVSLGSGGGLVLATETGNVVIFGIGPPRYWNKMGVDRPSVGDTIEVSGFAVDFNGLERNIAMSVLVSGAVVPLRDPDTAVPLWSGVRR